MDKFVSMMLLYTSLLRELSRAADVLQDLVSIGRDDLTEEDRKKLAEERKKAESRFDDIADSIKSDSKS